MSGKLKSVIPLTLMFLLGIVGGMAWQTYHFRHWQPMHAMFAEHRIKQMSAQLHLSDAQQQAMRDIFQKAHERAAQINEEVSWDLADVHRDSVEAIRKVLSPEQQQQFDKMHRKFHEGHHHMPDEDLDAPSPPPPTKGNP